MLMLGLTSIVQRHMCRQNFDFVRSYAHISKLNNLQHSRKILRPFRNFPTNERYFSYQEYMQACTDNALVNSIIKGLVHFHDFSGLGWLGTIVSSTLLIRVAMLPIFRSTFIGSRELAELRTKVFPKLKQDLFNSIKKKNPNWTNQEVKVEFKKQFEDRRIELFAARALAEYNFCIRQNLSPVTRQYVPYHTGCVLKRARIFLEDFSSRKGRPSNSPSKKKVRGLMKLIFCPAKHSFHPTPTKFVQKQVYKPDFVHCKGNGGFTAWCSWGLPGIRGFKDLVFNPTVNYHLHKGIIHLPKNRGPDLPKVNSEDLRTAGALWFKDLSLPDPTHILPITTVLLSLANIQFMKVDQLKLEPKLNEQLSNLRQQLQRYHQQQLGQMTVLLDNQYRQLIGRKYMIRGMLHLNRALVCTVVFAMAWMAPSGVVFYWCLSAICQFVQHFVLRLPRPARLLRIPAKYTDSKTPFKDYVQSLGVTLGSPFKAMLKFVFRKHK